MIPSKNLRVQFHCWRRQEKPLLKARLGNFSHKYETSWELFALLASSETFVSADATKFSLRCQIEANFSPAIRILWVAERCCLLQRTNCQCQAFHLLNSPTLGGMKTFLRQRRQKAYEVIIFLSRATKFVQIYSIHPPSSAADNQHWIIWEKVFVGKFCDRKLPKLASISRGNRFLKSVYWSESLESSNILIKSSSQLEESVYSFSLFSHEWKWDEKTFSPCKPKRKSFPSRKMLFPSKHRRERKTKNFSQP